MLETIELCAKEGIVLQKIISVWLKYLKPLKCVQTNGLWLVKNVTYKLFVNKSYSMCVYVQTASDIK